MASEPKIQIENIFRLASGSIDNLAAPSADHKLLFDEAVGSHPFVNKSHYSVIIDDDACVRDDKGSIVAILVKKALPTKVTEMASDVLRAAPARTSLRANIFGGEAPLSGIAGYYDYTGAPIEFKSRKTSFTCEHLDSWSKVFPLVNYVSEIYKAACPDEWEKQNGVIPDVVRIHGSPFSTLTLNQRFRTAKHTDSGDFDDGFGVLAVLEGNYEGLHLGIPDFGVCFRMMAGDVLLFNTHHFHCNTELEGSKHLWDRLTCVFYYRAMLGEPVSYNNYERRLEEAVAEGKSVRFDYIERKPNGVNLNRPAQVFAPLTSPFSICLSLNKLASQRHIFRSLQGLLSNKAAKVSIQTSGDGCPPAITMSATAYFMELFGDKRMDSNGLPVRTEGEVVSMLDTFNHRSRGATSNSGGFSDSILTPELLERQKHLLDLNVLKAGLPQALYDLYEVARGKWLSCVKADWKIALKNNPDRADFSWNNKGPVSTTFFELCDVATQVMLFLLGRDEALPYEKNAFWLSVAAHLQESTVTELGMPSTAMSMKKLNVKLKDYEFGGTRYFEDQSPEEQQRRISRQQMAYKARTDHTNTTTEANSSWLDNDAFDYQEEDVVVDYKGLNLALPEENPALERATAMGRALVDITVSSPSQSPTSGAANTTSAKGKPTRKRPTFENLNASGSSNVSGGDAGAAHDGVPKLLVCGPLGQAPSATIEASGVPTTYRDIVKAMRELATSGAPEIKATTGKVNTKGKGKKAAVEKPTEAADSIEYDGSDETPEKSPALMLADEAARFLSSPTLLLWYTAAIGCDEPQTAVEWPALELWATVKDSLEEAPSVGAKHSKDKAANSKSKTQPAKSVSTNSVGTEPFVRLTDTIAVGESGANKCKVLHALIDTSADASPLPASFDTVIARNLFSHTSDSDIKACMERLMGPTGSGKAITVVEPDLEDGSHFLLKLAVARAWAGEGVSADSDSSESATELVAGPICLRFAEMLKRESGIFGHSSLSRASVNLRPTVVFPFLRTRSELSKLLNDAGYAVHGQFTFKRSLTNSYAFVVTRK